ncbi:MAG: DUF2147 domain-containing protein [Pseudomonadota bacterium]
MTEGSGMTRLSRHVCEMALMCCVALAAVCAGAVAMAPRAAEATSAPIGLWFEHTGRGAVEISNCGNGLCGKLVWLKNAQNTSACGLEIIGDVQPVTAGRWDNGWIFDPDFGQKFDVELTPMENGDLRVLGYAGLKTLSQTMIWKRAPSDLLRCDTGEVTLR